MITAYYRPQSLAEAQKLLTHADTHPIGGGTVLNRPVRDSFAVVDLQALGLDKIRKTGEKLEIGATSTLQGLLESVHIPEALKTAIQLEAPLNLRVMGTAAGALVSCDGRSPFGVVMLALDAKLRLFDGQYSETSLGNLLPLRKDILRGTLITTIEIPLNTKLAYEYVARTPADKPILCAALAQWPSGRTQLAVGGWGASPTLAMDGNEASGLEIAARNAVHDAKDEWASAEYRMEIAAVLARRLSKNFNNSILPGI